MMKKILKTFCSDPCGKPLPGYRQLSKKILWILFSAALFCGAASRTSGFLRLTSWETHGRSALRRSFGPPVEKR